MENQTAPSGELGIVHRTWKEIVDSENCPIRFILIEAIFAFLFIDRNISSVLSACRCI